MRGLNAPTAHTNASSLGRARMAMCCALVAVTTKLHSASASSALSTTCACRPKLIACCTNASALARLREARAERLLAEARELRANSVIGGYTSLRDRRLEERRLELEEERLRLERIRLRRGY